MPRDYHSRERERRAKAKRDNALDRRELRQPSIARVHGTGVTSFPMKAEDPEVRRMIDEALAKRRAPQ